MRIRFHPNRTLAVPLETERFELRPVGIIGTFRLTDSWRTDPDMLGGVLYKANQSRLQWLKTGPFPDNATRFNFAIVPKGTDTPIGLHSTKLFGYRSARNMIGLSDRQWWGKGVTVEVRARLINHFFRLAGVERFCGSTSTRNTASIFNYRRLGFEHVGTSHRESVHPISGDVLDVMLFELFRETWAKGSFAEPDLAAAVKR